jgi:6-pyruvoyltetrahydropterin/6-carboxytetrahydropterin synthase
MKYSQYKFKFYLNANHAIYLGGVLGQNHPHTWEISLDTIKVRDDFIQFDIIEKLVEKYIAGFQDVDINKIAPFNVTNPTLENICDFLKKELGTLLNDNGWLLTKIEISETPSRSYIIDLTDDIDRIIENDTKKSQSISDLDARADEILDSLLGDNPK